MAHQSLKGQLLLDNGTLGGSFFQRTVVLICEHDAEGAFGLVLNRPSENKVGDAIVAALPEALKEMLLFQGGPVQPQALSYLYTASGLADANVMPGVRIGHSLDDLVDLGETAAPGAILKVFAGYAGWSPGQLDDEMRRNAWLTHPASVDWIFRAGPGDLWKEILRQLDWHYRLLADSPEDLSAN